MIPSPTAMVIGQILHNDEALGIGFTLVPGLVLTARHLLRSCDTCALRFALRDGEPLLVKRVEQDASFDVAVLHVAHATSTALPLARPVYGERWSVASQPCPGDPLLDGVVTAPRRTIINADGHEVAVIQLQVTQLLSDYSGYSGSPVLSEQGAVIGMLVEQVPMRGNAARLGLTSNVLYAVPADTIIKRFDLSEHVTWEVADGAHSSVSTTEDRRSLPLFQLPRAMPDFTGRADAIKWLSANLQRDSMAPIVVTLYGKPGVGKSALATYTAHHLSGRFPDGQLHVDLRGAEETDRLAPETVLAELLRALGIPGSAIPDGREPRARLYRTTVSTRRLLLVLDNAFDERQVRPLLPGSGASRVLVTSRAPLRGLEGALFRSLDVLSEREALALLRKIAGDERIARDPAVVAKIVQLCGRLPLAIRIAGAILATRRDLSLSGFASRLTRARSRLGELRAGDLDVRASFSLSYDDLDPGDQRAFRVLGTIKAPDFAEWTAIALLGDDGFAGEHALDRLVHAQMLEVAGTDMLGQIRFKFHDLLLEYSKELLDSGDSQTSAESTTRMLRESVQRATIAASALSPTPQTVDAAGVEGDDDDTDYLAWFSVERTFLVSAVNEAAALGQCHVTIDLALALAEFFQVCSGWDDWRDTHSRALDAALLDNDQHAEARVRRSMGRLHVFQGKFASASALFERALELFELEKDELEAAITLHGLGDLHRRMGDLDAAFAVYARALHTFEVADVRFWAAAALRNLGVVRRYRGELAAARRDFEHALDIFDGLHSQRWLGATLHSLGDLARYEDDLEKAKGQLTRCLEIFRAIHDRRWEAATLRSLGIVNAREGRTAVAVNLFETALATFREFGDRLWEAAVLRARADLLIREGHLDEALVSLRVCLRIFCEHQDTRWQAKTMMSVGCAEAARDEPDSARRSWSRARELLEGSGSVELRVLNDWLSARELPS
jgi:tetratricopeptide (TPR) repeat protein